MRRIAGILLFTVIIIFFRVSAFAQCAMCRATMENSISKDSKQFAAGLNAGIIYLFIMPYLIVGIIGYLWYRESRKQNGKVKITIRSGRKMS